MTTQMKNNITIVKHFLHRECLIFKKEFFDTIIDNISWPLGNALVFGYVMPSLGLGASYAGFMVVSATVGGMLFLLFVEATFLSMDYDNERKVNFEMMLPWSISTLVLKNGLRMTFIGISRTALLPFLAKLVLPEQLSLKQFSLPLFIIALILVNVSLSFLMLIFAGLVQSGSIERFRLRVIDQLFFFGCFMFPWTVMYKVLPRLALLNLLNPVTHAMEMTRVAFLGQQDSLPFWISAVVLILYSGLFFKVSVWAFKKRLDCVMVS